MTITEANKCGGYCIMLNVTTVRASEDEGSGNDDGDSVGGDDSYGGANNSNSGDNNDNDMMTMVV